MRLKQSDTNCNCINCNGVRNGTIQAKPRTQSSIAISANDDNCILFNASPDIRAQLESFPELQPALAMARLVKQYGYPMGIRA